jgi:hypothetical protein
MRVSQPAAPDAAPEVVDGTTRRVDRFDDPLGMTDPREAFENQAQRVAARERAQSDQEARRAASNGYQPPTMGATELNTPAVRNAMEQDQRPDGQQSSETGTDQRRRGTGSSRVSPDQEMQQSNQRTRGQGSAQEPQIPADADPEQVSKYEELTQRLLDPDIDDAMREALTIQRNAVGRALGIAEYFDERVRGAGNALGAATDYLGQGFAKGISLFSPDAGAPVNRAFRGGSKAYTDPNAGGDAAERAAMESAIEAANLRRQNGITDARDSMGAKITAGDTAGAAAQAQQARNATASEQNPDPQTPELRTKPGQSNDGKPRLQYPASMSVTDAVTQGTRSYAMSDGSAVQSGRATQRSLNEGGKRSLDYILSRGDEVVAALVSKGMLTEAREYREFLDGEQASQGATHMGRATVAANAGDTTAFSASLDAMVRAYEPDGLWQVDRAGTRLIEGANGQPVGAVLSMTNKESGETIEQEYMGMQNVLNGISDWGSPLAAYQRQRERVNAALAQKVSDAEEFTSAYDAAMELLFPDGFFDRATMQQFTPEQRQEADRAVRQYIGSSRPDLPQPQPGAASGVGVVQGGSNGQPVPTFGG